MNNKLIITFSLVMIFISGCNNNAGIKPPEEGKTLITVDFQKGVPLKYSFISSRKVKIDFNPSPNSQLSGGTAVNESTEELLITMTYTPLEVNPFGLTTIIAKCQSAKVNRKGDNTKDAAEYFAGTTFTFTIDSQGKIHDYSKLDELINQVSEKAFSGTADNRTKQQDMICDFIATQWFLWDSIASIENPSHGTGIGQSWKSKLPVPTPMVSRLARNVTYTLEEISKGNGKNIAAINSTYTQANEVPQKWPIPFHGNFQMKGTFGLLGNYKLLNLKGSGTELFDIDSGRTEEYEQQYEMNIQASIPMGIGGNPLINIEQTITMKLLDE